jgi:hypothetical protein
LSALLVLLIAENWEVKFTVVPNGIMSIPFIQICPVVLELNHADRQTWPALNAFISCTSCKECVTRGNSKLH